MARNSLNFKGMARRVVVGVGAASALILAPLTPAHATFENGVQAYLNGQYLQALDIWERFAKAGDVRSKKILGDVYSGKPLEGAEGAASPLEQIPVDNVQALVWYTLAAHHNFSQFSTPSAHEVSAQILANQRLPDIRGRMSTSEVNKAERLVSQTFEAGSAYDLFQLGQMYQKGAGIKKDNTRALQLYELAKQRGVDKASTAYELLEPLMTPREKKDALKRAAEWQPPLPPDYTKTPPQLAELEKARRQAEEIKMADALNAVSDIDVELLQRALAALGYRPGGIDNELGPSTRAAIRRFQYASVASDLDLSEAEKQKVVTGVLTPEQTVSLIRDAADSGHPMSTYVYGIMYTRGIGVVQNGAEAVSWLEKAADKDLAIAHFALGVIFRDGTTGLNSVSPDSSKAARHFARAAALGYTPASDSLRRLQIEQPRDRN